MKRGLTLALAGLALLLTATTGGHAQARRVKMKIDGYLCGN